MAEQINLSDFNFQTASVRHSAHNRDLYDIVVTWRNKGRLRKTSNYNLVITNLARKEKANFMTVAVGANKYKRGGRVILAFNNKALAEGNAPIRHEPNTDSYVVSSKPHAFKILEEFGIEEPNKPDTGLSFYLKAEKIEGQPNVYILKPVSISHTDASGKVETKTFQK